MGENLKPRGKADLGFKFYAYFDFFEKSVAFDLSKKQLAFGIC